MADVVSIDVPRVRAAAHALRVSAESLDTMARAASRCEFASATSGTVDPVREQAVREGYLRLARAIGAWGSASEAAGRVLGDTADAYERQDAVTAGSVVALGGR